MEDAEALVAQVVDFGGVDIVVNNAVLQRIPFNAHDGEDFNRVIEVNQIQPSTRLKQYSAHS